MIRVASRFQLAARRVATSNQANQQWGVQLSSFSLSVSHGNERGCRTFATDSNAAGSTKSDVENTLDKLFENNANNLDVIGEATVTDLPADVWDPTWYNVADQAINGINFFRDLTELGYGEAIIGITVMIRIALFPLFVKLQKNTARMAHMQPEMKALKQQLDNLGSNVDQATQIKYGLQMRALFKKYDCNPLSSLVPPLVQIPVFMGMFFGLRKMPEFPMFADALSTEGLLWFQDLTACDPYYVLPVLSATTMLAAVELNKAQMMASNPQQGEIMVNVFRALSVVMIPAIANFPASLNLYWFCNNSITAMQASAFRTKSIRKALGIWEMPKPVPGMPAPESIVETIQKAVARKPSEADLMKEHNVKIENQKKLEEAMSAGNDSTAATASGSSKSRGTRRKIRTRRR